MGAHFTEAGLRFLRGLKRNNDRDWFNARKAIYERELKEPMLAVIAEVNEAMLGYAPEHVRAPAKTMMRLYRDIRFSKDKRPYKHQVSAWWARSGLEKTSGAGFYFHVSGISVEIAAGVFMPEREHLLAIRRHLTVHHEALRRELRSRKLQKLGLAAIAGNPLARPPKGFAGESAAMDLLLCREWGVSATLPVESALESGFTKELGLYFRQSAGIVTLLNEPLTVRPKRNALAPLLSY